ncbi:MAG: hypothetical protein HN757_04945 [Calditrichaeota bacterium]|nr:hypothetical protein [Calditrichota bacterium]
MKDIYSIALSILLFSGAVYCIPHSDWEMTIIDSGTDLDSLSSVSNREYRKIISPRTKGIDRIYRHKPITDGKGRVWQIETERVLYEDDTTAGWFIGGYDSQKNSHNSRFHVVLDNDTISSFRAVSHHLGSNPISKAFLQNDNYLITYEKYLKCEKREVIHSINAFVNGEDLNFSCRYENSLAPAFIEGKLFYLFQKNGKWGWSYDGVDHPGLWDKVFYGDGGYGVGDFLFRADPTYSGFTVWVDGKWSNKACVFVQ